jgi:elongation factor 3
VAALALVGSRARKVPKLVAAYLPDILPQLTEASHDTRSEVVKAAELALTDVTCQEVIGNRDVEHFVPAVLSCLARPGETPETVHKLSSTTFVSRVEPPVLALMVPVLENGLRDRATAVKRRCCE